MLRGYRLPILAAFGLLVVAAAPSDKQTPEQKGGQHQAPAKQTITQAPPPPAPPVALPIQGPEKDRGCEKGQDARDSDLCAQWKAADAASDAAKWSLVSVWVGVAGAALLLWTLWETRLTGRRGLRAYVVLKSGEVEKMAVGQPVLVRAYITNCGQTPAMKLQAYCGVRLRPPNHDFHLVLSPLDSGIDMGAGIDHEMQAFDEAPLTLEQLRQIEAGELCVYLAIVGRYVDIFGATHKIDILVANDRTRNLRPVR